MIHNWRSEILLWLILLAMLIAAGMIWPYAPESMPVHWNLQGEVDRFGGKWEGLLAIPLISVFLYGLMVVLPRIDPGRANYPSFRSAYYLIRLALLLFLGALYAAMLLVTFGYPIKINLIVPVALGLLFLLLGRVMGQIRPNWFVGIRTPWTLSSRRSWDETHRLGGWLFAMMGVVVAVCGFIQTVWMLIAAGVVIAGSVIGMMVYSYLVWRNDPNKLTTGSIITALDKNQPMQS